MEPVKCSHPACGRYTFGVKCDRHTFEVLETVLGSESARDCLLLDSEAARGIPAVFGGSVRVSPRWQSSGTRIRNSRARRTPRETPRETVVVATTGNGDRYAARLALLGAIGDANH
jgi:hypothetical protein